MSDLARISSDVLEKIQSYSPEIWSTLKNLLYIRLVFTVLIVCWGAVVSWKYNHTRDPVKQEQIKYTNFIWAGSGKSGIFMTLFWIWVLTILGLSAYPLLVKVLSQRGMLTH